MSTLHGHSAASITTRDGLHQPSLAAVLFALLGGALMWVLHILGAYVLITWACAEDWPHVRLVLLALTVVTVAVTAWSGVVARHQWLRARATDRPTDDAGDARMGERTARVSFIMVTGLLLAVVFGAAEIFQALAMPFTPLCEAGVPR